MGTINYGSASWHGGKERICVGLNLIDFDKEFDNEDDKFDAIRECYDEMGLYLDRMDDIDSIKVEMKPGYYEGFYLDFDFDYYNNVTKEEFEGYLSDAERLRQMLIDIIDTQGYMTVCHPGWCTSYCNKDESIEEINKFVDAYIEELNTITVEEENNMDNIEIIRDFANYAMLDYLTNADQIREEFERAVNELEDELIFLRGLVNSRIESTEKAVMEGDEE